jgi:hypothetical protein
MSEVPLHPRLERRGSKTATHRAEKRISSLTKKINPLGPYRRPMPRVLGGSQGGGRFLMGEIPLHSPGGSVSLLSEEGTT